MSAFFEQSRELSRVLPLRSRLVSRFSAQSSSSSSEVPERSSSVKRLPRRLRICSGPLSVSASELSSLFAQFSSEMDLQSAISSSARRLFEQSSVTR